MNELGEALNLPEPPFRIETIDISNAADADIVASLVVFEDGLPKKSDYRRFIIKSVDGQDDFASVAEVCRRRFAATTKREGFAKPPNLVVIDGGLGQVNAASAAMKEVGSAQVPVVGLAKRLEEIYLPGLSQPISLPRNSQGLFLLQRMRDEAHRFANSHLQQRRKKRLLASELDSITGLGETKKRDLLAHFGSLAKVRESSVEQLCEVSGIGPALAQQIHSHFHQRAH
jgi:excinuclease ABC subunit C